MKICIKCGREFYAYNSQENKKYCSLECYKEYRKNNMKSVCCIFCSKNFKVLNCHKNKKYCSDNCRILYKKEFREKNKIIKKCEVCGKKIFFYRKSNIKKTCSKICWNKLQGQKRVGIKWKMSKEVKQKLSFARKKYLSNSDNLKKHAEYTKNSWLNEKTRKLRLTKERAQKISNTEKKQYAEGKRKPPFVKNAMYSKITKYNNVIFRSTWEAKVAKWLDKNNIKWIYESKECIVKLPIGSIYIIDFYLPEINKYIEVKGIFDDYSIYKLDRATIKGYDIYIVDKTNINNISLENSWITQSKYFMEMHEYVGEI
jgi:hypothetical protein